MVLIRLFSAAALLLIVSEARATSEGRPWFFTASEIESAYRYQEHFGRRLTRPLKPVECYGGKTEFVASARGKEFSAPCKFITEATRHLKEMLKTRAAKYLFPLDADHAHLAIPVPLWDEKYSKLPSDELLPLLLRESALVALYHTAEQLMISDPKSGRIHQRAKDWKAKRNVLGFFDGRSLKILPSRPDGSAREKPEYYETAATIYFLGHRLGELVLSARGKAFPFDMSFDEDFAIKN